MEPLLDKVARMKSVRKIFDTILVWDNQSGNWAKVRAKIPMLLKIVGLLFGPFVFYTVWPFSVWGFDANDGHPFAPETGSWFFANAGVAFGVCCLWCLPIPFKARLWLTLPYMLIFGWLLMWYAAFANMMFWGF